MPGLRTIAREWGRIGVLGFGGPPTHLRMLRDLTVEREGWLDDAEFEDAVAACNLLPGPASTQMSIFTAWRVGGWRGGIVGGLAFIVPGLLAILALSALFLGDPPAWVLGAGAGAGAAVPAVAVHAGWGLTPASWRRRSSWRWLAYVVGGAVGAVLLGAWLVLLLLACGVVESVARRTSAATAGVGIPLLASRLVAGATTTAVSLGLAGSIAWTALKVGALSYGGGFVIIPLMRADAVDTHGWMTQAQFLNAVALGQITPGPVIHTVAVVGWAAGGLGGALLAAVVAFAPSFVFVLGGGRHLDRLRSTPVVRAFLDGAGPAAIGAIYGSAVLLAAALSETWQYVVLAGALGWLLLARRGVVSTLLLAAAVGVVVSQVS